MPASTPTTSSTDDELRQQVLRITKEPQLYPKQNDAGYKAQSPMTDQIMALIRQDREAREAAMLVHIRAIRKELAEQKELIAVLQKFSPAPPDSKAKA